MIKINNKSDSSAGGGATNSSAAAKKVSHSPSTSSNSPNRKVSCVDQKQSTLAMYKIAWDQSESML